MDLKVKLQDQIIRRYANSLGQLGATQGHRALARAVNRTTASVQSRVIRAIAKQSSIPAKIVRSQIKRRTVRPGGGATLEGIIYASGKSLSLKAFKPRQFQYGVKVKLWGKQRRMDGTFIYAGSSRSGKYVADGHVFQRVTRKSLPIQKQFGPCVPTEMVRDASAQVFYATVAQMLPARVAHEINRLLPSS